VKRLFGAALFASGCALAGLFSGAVIADVTTSTGTTTVETSTAAQTTTETTTEPTTTTAPTTTTRPRKPKPAVLPGRVRVAGVRVGGLAPAAAVAVVDSAFARRLVVAVDGRRLTFDPMRFATAYTATAVARARVSQPGTNVHLVVAVHGAPLRAWVAAVARRFDRKPVDATLKLTAGTPSITPARNGRAVNQKKLTTRLIAALHQNSRLPIGVHTRAVPPLSAVGTAATPTIVINRETNHLYLFDGATLRRTFPVATGQAIYPTPKGTWHIVVKWKNPWWYPPVNDAWARGLKPVPPGPSNPLGTRWMGLDAPGVGIHGTDEPSSIGYSASHGCIRMQVPDAEWLFDQVDIGTTVYIV
jgi:lipoprotein-anchoring transpeptidase ErfK/SrfK